MLGITYHNPATVSVYLDRMRFKDCFISTAELRDGEWQRKLKGFVDLPSDGRDRVVFIESFATLQTLLQHGASFDNVKVAVYDDCDVLSRVPGASIVDAHINGDETDTWQLYSVSFGEFNEALAAQPIGVPALIRDHRLDEDADLPEQKPVATKAEEPRPAAGDEEPVEKEKPASMLVMEQILDDIEAGDEEEEEAEPVSYEEPGALPDAALTARPEVDPGNVVQEAEAAEPAAGPEAEPIATTRPAPIEPEPEQKPKAKRKRARKPKAPKLESYELF